MNDTPEPGNSKKPAGRKPAKRLVNRGFNTTKKIFSHDSPSSTGPAVVSNNSDSLAFKSVSLAPGPVIQIHSPRMRNTVDTFLKTTSNTHTVVRSILQGPDGGFQGDMDAIVLGLIDKDICSAVLAITKGRRWFIHARNPESLETILAAVPRGYKPHILEGHANVTALALEYKPIKKLKHKKTRKYAHYSMAPRVVHISPGGHNRLAIKADIPRLEEYAENLENEVGVFLIDTWDRMIAENRIMLGVVEGTVASVAIRAAQTIDQILIDGIYTFKPFRRRGIASRLIAALTAQAAGRGQSSGVIVNVDNFPMIQLMEKMEFQRDQDYRIEVF